MEAAASTVGTAYDGLCHVEMQCQRLCPPYQTEYVNACEATFSVRPRFARGRTEFRGDSSSAHPALACNERAVLIRLGNIPGQVLLEENRSHRRGLAEDIELALADQPVLRIGLVELAQSPCHGAEVAELRRVADGIGLEQLAVLRADEAVAVLVPFKFDVRQPALRASDGEIRNGIIAFDRQRDLFRGNGRDCGHDRGGCDQQTETDGGSPRDNMHGEFPLIGLGPARVWANAPGGYRARTGTIAQLDHRPQISEHFRRFLRLFSLRRLVAPDWLATQKASPWRTKAHETGTPDAVYSAGRRICRSAA